MISWAVAIVFATQPLMATGNDLGVWFIRDTAPGSIGATHELCFQINNDKYQVVLPLSKRPVALAIHDQTLWFVGENESPILYRARLVQDKATGSFSTSPSERANAVAQLAFEGKIKDIVFLDDDPILVIENDGVQCFSVGGSSVTPLLHGEGNHVAVLGNSLIAVVVDDPQSVTTYTYQGDGWELGAKYEFEGNIHDLIVHDGWPLLVTSVEEGVKIVGLQQTEIANIAAFPMLSGRWAIVSSNGLHAIGVERNSTTTFFDIGWPSGKTSKPIQLTEFYGTVGLVELTVMVLTTVICIIMMISILRKKPKLDQK